MVEGKHTNRVQKHAASAEASGVQGTPTFFVNGVRHVGPFDAETLSARLLETRAVTERQGT